jgi:hypothetical protein
MDSIDHGAVAMKPPMAEPLDEYRITSHAIVEMKRRGIDYARVAPHDARRPRRAKISFGDETCLVRVFVDVGRKSAEVVTVYRTGNIARYWRVNP